MCVHTYVSMNMCMHMYHFYHVCPNLAKPYILIYTYIRTYIHIYGTRHLNLVIEIWPSRTPPTQYVHEYTHVHFKRINNTHIHSYIHTHTHTEREREREREQALPKSGLWDLLQLNAYIGQHANALSSVQTSVYMHMSAADVCCVYVYVYTFVYLHVSSYASALSSVRTSVYMHMSAVDVCCVYVYVFVHLHVSSYDIALSSLQTSEPWRLFHIMSWVSKHCRATNAAKFCAAPPLFERASSEIVY